MKCLLCLLLFLALSQASILRVQLKVGDSYTISGPNNNWTRVRQGQTSTEKLKCQGGKCHFVGADGKEVTSSTRFLFNDKNELLFENVQSSDAGTYTNTDSTLSTHHEDGTITSVPAPAYMINIE